jgi:dTDP-4-amino-4,6-dideoxygalactose transaminase
MNEVSAAMGISTLEVRADILDHNLSVYKAYLRQLEGVEGLSIVQYDSFNDPNYHYIVIEIDEAVTGVSRDDVYEILHAENVLARRYFYPGCHRMEPYASNPIYAGESLPHTEIVSERVLVLTTGTAITTIDAELICELIKFIIQNGAEITERVKLIS